MSKQTAVNWLIDKIYFKYVIVNRKLLDQAIEIEKQQLIDFANDFSNDDSEETLEQFYNETFKKS